MRQRGLILAGGHKRFGNLPALLFPVYLKSRSRAHKIRCANQLRQIGLAIRLARLIKVAAGTECEEAFPSVVFFCFPAYLPTCIKSSGALLANSFGRRNS